MALENEAMADFPDQHQNELLEYITSDQCRQYLQEDHCYYMKEEICQITTAVYNVCFKKHGSV